MGSVQQTFVTRKKGVELNEGNHKKTKDGFPRKFSHSFQSRDDYLIFNFLKFYLIFFALSNINKIYRFT